MRLVDILHTIEADMLHGFAVAEKVTSAILKFATSPEGKTIEEVIAAVVPQGKSYTTAVITLASDMGSDIAAISNPTSRLGIALRLGAEILAVIHGGKLPQGINGYIAEFQKIFLG